MQTAAIKPETETTTTKSPTKSPTLSNSSSLALSMQAHTSPATLLTLSTSVEQENPDDGYILLDECFSGTSSTPLMMSTSSGTPSPGNTLSSRSSVPLSAEYQYPDNDSKTTDDFPPPHESVQFPQSSDVHTERSADNIFDSGPVSLDSCDDDSTIVGIWDSHSTMKSDNGELPPALPAKVTLSTAVPDVEYDVPQSGLGQGSASHPHGSPAPPPQPHMVIPPTQMHRYINTAPAFIRSQTPMRQNLAEFPSSGQQKYQPLYVECIPRGHGQSGTRPGQAQNAAASALLPPKAHG